MRNHKYFKKSDFIGPQNITCRAYNPVQRLKSCQDNNIHTTDPNNALPSPPAVSQTTVLTFTLTAPTARRNCTQTSALTSSCPTALSPATLWWTPMSSGTTACTTCASTTAWIPPSATMWRHTPKHARAPVSASAGGPAPSVVSNNHFNKSVHGGKVWQRLTSSCCPILQPYPAPGTATTLSARLPAHPPAPISSRLFATCHRPPAWRAVSAMVALSWAMASVFPSANAAVLIWKENTTMWVP